MPRKLLKRYMPKQNALKSHKHLKWLGEHLHNPDLFHLTRKSAAKAFLVGIFCAFLPIPGQMIVAAFLALWIGSNLPISIGLVWLTNPITIPPIFYTTYKLGAWILGTPPVKIHWELHSIHTELATIWWPLLTGSLLCGVFLSGLSYLAINRLWIWQVRRRWQKRLLKARASKH
jgi:uncharacterized protein (DUF2062 family)